MLDWTNHGGMVVFSGQPVKINSVAGEVAISLTWEGECMRQAGQSHASRSDEGRLSPNLPVF